MSGDAVHVDTLSQLRTGSIALGVSEISKNLHESSDKNTRLEAPIRFRPSVERPDADEAKDVAHRASSGAMKLVPAGRQIFGKLINGPVMCWNAVRGK
jgi:hypothetical protein